MTHHELEDQLSRLQPIRPIKLPRVRQRFGCWQRILIALLIAPLTCAALTLLYVIVPPPPADILVLGLDARPGESYATRTDSIILVGIQPRRMRVSLLSIPRDVFITVPGYGSQRINTVNVLGELEASGYGPELLSDAVSQNFNVGVDRYARLNFDAFVQMVDAVGGVTIDVPRVIVDNAYPTRDGGTISIRFEEGRQRMDGETALAYARTRHADDDYARAGRQQQVLSALGRKLANPLNWPRAWWVLRQNMDTNMSIWYMGRYIPPVIFSGGSFDRLVIDREYVVGASGGVAPNYALLEPWIASRYD